MAKQADNLPAVVEVAEYAIMKHDQKMIQEVMKENIGTGGLTAGSLDRIKIPAGGGLTWEVPTLEGETSQPFIDGIIIHWQDVRLYYATEYNGEKSPPTCSSQDGVHGVGDPGGECEKCPFAEFGSAQKGAGQACKQCRRVFICGAADLLPILITLPPTSLGAVKKHFQRLASRAIPFYGVVTRFGLEKDKNQGGIAYSRATLSVVKALTTEETARFRELHKMYVPILSSLNIEATDYADGHEQ